VRDEFRSVGFGRRLLEHLLERAAAAGTNEAYLEVRPSNLSAIRLYQRLGFEQIGIRRGYYQAPDGREDAIVLKLELRQATH
jgi:[ribosomal protein S18]-alanine N-acetyltransferase